MRTALNEVLRNEYIKDCQRGVDRWNKTIRRGDRRRAQAAAPGVPPGHRRLAEAKVAPDGA